MTACTPQVSLPELPTENGHTLKGALSPAENKPNKHASTISSWEVTGAIAARNKNKAWTASLNWVQQGANQYQIRLFGPLGGGTVIIENRGGNITYLDGPKKITSRNADQLLQQQTGVRLPVHDLYYWVRGLAAPGTVQSSKYDKNTHLTSLSQAGYTINYINYTSVGSVDLPSKIELQGHGVVIKLVIKNWAI